MDCGDGYRLEKSSELWAGTTTLATLRVKVEEAGAGLGVDGGVSWICSRRTYS